MTGRMLENPGAATASYVGYICFMQFRDRLQTALGDDFRFTDYHTLVLEGGPMPMEILDRVVDDYIDAHQ